MVSKVRGSILTPVNLNCQTKHLDYSAHNRPTTQGIGKLLMKFEGAGTVRDIVRSAHHRVARATSSVATVSNCVAADPNVPISRRTQELKSLCQ